MASTSYRVEMQSVLEAIRVCIAQQPALLETRHTGLPSAICQMMERMQLMQCSCSTLCNRLQSVDGLNAPSAALGLMHCPTSQMVKVVRYNAMAGIQATPHLKKSSRSRRATTSMSTVTSSRSSTCSALPTQTSLQVIAPAPPPPRLRFRQTCLVSTQKGMENYVSVVSSEH